MVFAHDINNNILNSGAIFSSVHQDEYEKWGIYQEIDSFEFGTKEKKCINCGVSSSYNNQQM